MTEPVQVLRYANRKLYVKGRGYIKLTDLEGYIVAGTPFRVFDMNSADAREETAIVLARLLASRAELGLVATEALLRALEQSYDTTTRQ